MCKDPFPHFETGMPHLKFKILPETVILEPGTGNYSQPTTLQIFKPVPKHSEQGYENENTMDMSSEDIVLKAEQ